MTRPPPPRRRREQVPAPLLGRFRRDTVLREFARWLPFTVIFLALFCPLSSFALILLVGSKRISAPWPIVGLYMAFTFIVFAMLAAAVESVLRVKVATILTAIGNAIRAMFPALRKRGPPGEGPEGGG